MSKKTLLISYFTTSFIMIFIGYVSGHTARGVINPSLLHFSDVIQIFLINSIYALLWYLSALFGLSFIPILSFILKMGSGGKLSGIDPLIYYSSSLSHGLGELLVGFIVISFTIDHIKYLVLFFRNKIDLNIIKNFYLTTMLKTIPTTFLILFLSALSEVFISNRILIYLIKSGF